MVRCAIVSGIVRALARNSQGGHTTQSGSTQNAPSAGRDMTVQLARFAGAVEDQQGTFDRLEQRRH
jgi:hypothetical protein